MDTPENASRHEPEERLFLAIHKLTATTCAVEVVDSLADVAARNARHGSGADEERATWHALAGTLQVYLSRPTAEPGEGV